jgi:hypothetical protein
MRSLSKASHGDHHVSMVVGFLARNIIRSVDISGVEESKQDAGDGSSLTPVVNRSPLTDRSADGPTAYAERSVQLARGQREWWPDVERASIRSMAFILRPPRRALVWRARGCRPPVDTSR